MKALILYYLTLGLYNQAILAPLHFVTPGSLIFDRMIDFYFGLYFYIDVINTYILYFYYLNYL